MKGKLLPIDVEKWISGDISVEQFDVQGIFFSICCVYYKKDCLCKIVDIEKRFPNNKKELDYLYQKYIQKEGEDIKIEWVNTIFKRKQSTSSINKKNGQKGQFKKKQELTTPPLESSNTPGQPGDKTETPTIPTIKITKEEKIKKLNERILVFAETLKPYLEVYGREMIQEFYKYWKEQTTTGYRFRKELQRTWDLKLRLDNWSKTTKVKVIKAGSVKKAVSTGQLYTRDDEQK